MAPTDSSQVSLPTKEDLKKIHPHLKASNGRRVLRGMFYELINTGYNEEDPSEPYFTLKDRNIEKRGRFLWSMKNIYLSYEHIPGFEYEFALDVIGSWDHWVLLCESTATGPYIAAWRDEQAIKLQAKAMKALFKTALFEGAKGTPAAKFIADKGWEVKRGRPSKEDVIRERKQAAGLNEQVQKDMERLGISVVKGGKA